MWITTRSLLNHNMQITTTKSQQIKSWLLDRGLSEEVIEASGLEWNGHEIVIPIFDKEKNFVFNKYRRDPFSTDDTLPKYRYELGSTAHLYNAQTIKDVHNETIFICEGELDCLLLNSLGLFAVSSTGGSGTFRPDWFLDIGNNDIFICYDKDDAGIKGALRINTMKASAKIIFLPENTKGKDVTDFFKTHTMADLQKLAANATSWVLPMDVKEMPQAKSGIDAILKTCGRQLDELLEKKRELNSLSQSVRHIEIMMDIIAARIDNWKKHKAAWGNQSFTKNNDDISRAKAVPIPQYIKFDHNGFSKCLWHDEKTGSMKYRPERNKVFCHGCGAHKDVIDVVMQQQGVEFNAAVRSILGR